jgi:hypothetical protein
VNPSAGLEPFRGLACDLGDEFEVLNVDKRAVVGVRSDSPGPARPGRTRQNLLLGYMAAKDHHGEAIKRLGVLVDKISSPARRR